MIPLACHTLKFLNPRHPRCMQNDKSKYAVFDFWLTKTWKSKYAICQSNIPEISRNAYFDFWVLENQNMDFGIFDWHWLVKYPKMHILIFEFWSVKNPKLQISICSLMYPKMHILIFEFWKIRIYILWYFD